jgi:hypothetical protein
MRDEALLVMMGRAQREPHARPQIEEFLAARGSAGPDRPLDQSASVLQTGERCHGLQENRGVMGETPSYLDPLRDRADFQKLLAEQEAHSARK